MLLWSSDATNWLVFGHLTLLCFAGTRMRLNSELGGKLPLC